MENNWYDFFIEALHHKYPKKSQLTQELVDLLYIEREAVYRRLRKDVLFPVDEIVKIASEWNISLDEIIGISTGQISFQMRKMNYLDPSDDETRFLRQIIRSIGYFKDFPNTEFMDICNKFPRQIFSGYEYLNKFNMFKWIYQYGNEDEVVPFAKIELSPERLQLTADYYQAIKKVPNTFFIWDRMLFDNFVSDIKYFNAVQMITKEEKDLIRKDLFALLDYMQEVASKGFFPETHNKVTIYISQLSINTNYSYVLTPEANICFVSVFEKYDIYTFDSEMIKHFRLWMQQKKRSSIQISEVDERNRIEYFTRQRQLISTL